MKLIKENIDDIINDYNKNLLKDNESPISNKTVENAITFENYLKNNDIKNYKIVPSPIGAIYFEWRDETISLGVGIKDDLLRIEYFNIKDKESWSDNFILKDNKEQIFNLVTSYL